MNKAKELSSCPIPFNTKKSKDSESLKILGALKTFYLQIKYNALQ